MKDRPHFNSCDLTETIDVFNLNIGDAPEQYWKQMWEKAYEKTRWKKFIDQCNQIIIAKKRAG